MQRCHIAIFKSTFSDGFQTAAEGDTFQTGHGDIVSADIACLQKSVLTDEFQRVGKCDVLQRTGIKGIVANGAEMLPERKRCQFGAGGKCAVADGFHTAGQDNRLQRTVTRKQAVGNTGNRRTARKGEGLQAGAFAKSTAAQCLHRSGKGERGKGTFAEALLIDDFEARLAAEGHIGGVAAGKRPFADAFYRIGNGDFGEIYAIAEGSVIDVHHAAAQLERGEGSTIEKGILSDDGHGIGNRDRCHGAAPEGVITDRRNLPVKADIREFAAIPPIIIAAAGLNLPRGGGHVTAAADIQHAGVGIDAPVEIVAAFAAGGIIGSLHCPPAAAEEYCHDTDDDHGQVFLLQHKSHSFHDANCIAYRTIILLFGDYVNPVCGKIVRDKGFTFT